MSTIRNIRWGRVVITATAVAIVAGCTYHLAVTLRPQQTSMWCWAASGQMVMEFVEPSQAPSQCEQANNRFGYSDCCSSPTPAHCVKGGWPEFGKYGFSYKTTSWSPLTPTQLRSELIGQRPVAFSWHWNGEAAT
jgi:hypothetical protein